jgi:hypothetical protein
MHIQLCRSIRTNGVQCRGAALTGSPLCYFHARLHQAHARYRQTDASRLYLDLPPGQNIELGPLEDHESIQIAISQVINALATGQLDPKRATALLYGLQLASSNAAHILTEPHASIGVRHLETTPEDAELPGLDLAQPGRIYDTDPPQETFDDEQDEDEEYEQEIEDRVNERLAEIEAQKLEDQRLEAPKIEDKNHEVDELEQEVETADEEAEGQATIPTIQATAAVPGPQTPKSRLNPCVLRILHKRIQRRSALTHNCTRRRLTAAESGRPRYSTPRD